eukprot:CAMPEP_0113693538 /NCGR_PEP_ID=MMETSP0038_2-20120614/19719_1 /TAXON_ID=2898 /ORGANISM="Cryptomonas paramecium" /LENGTH=120 /DNA_ID=CAMNT_0000615619 /DNA_START=1102 /DNA_END=1464 /DNA_ORIENTATION=- /assembly_acc=CAM_ASM_000170
MLSQLDPQLTCEVALNIRVYQPKSPTINQTSVHKPRFAEVPTPFPTIFTPLENKRRGAWDSNATPPLGKPRCHHGGELECIPCDAPGRCGVVGHAIALEAVRPGFESRGRSNTGNVRSWP